MTKIHKLKVEPMTKENFSPYGLLLDAEERPSDHRILATVDFQADGAGTLGVIWQPYQGVRFSQLERHFGVTQSFIQMSGSPAVVAVAEPTNMDDPMASPNPEDVRAFLIDANKGYVLNRGTWHSLNRYILTPPGAVFAILNSSPNPTQIVDYEKNYSLHHQDLGVTKRPERVDLGDRYGLVFELDV